MKDLCVVLVIVFGCKIGFWLEVNVWFFFVCNYDVRYNGVIVVKLM